ncbi:hypothetical protein G7Y89_g850 [Cudoniella acicularis]|uniref:alpha-L-rhamnosidase n=1 Tax=Cudoniella acicularis TaxID=354080 RepID=A0A8H4RWE5_9HELO|nr:hypothetical protein G7Y89_g850 [Cudoniella acicularis]
MDTTTVRPERTIIGVTLEIPRMISGLWQLAGGHHKDVKIADASNAIESLIKAGLECFDMADHYGDAELVVGHHNANSQLPLTAFTKWCPQENGVKTFGNAEKAIDLALSRLSQKQIAILQYHAWDYSDDTFIHNLTHLRTMQKQGKIAHIGLTNTNTAHLKMLLDSGFTIATNQVPCSVIDRRITRGGLDNLCIERDVGLLCYGTLLGGFLSEKWVGKPEPEDINELNWSLRKYLRFIWAAGGWDAYQGILKALDIIGKKHSVPISAVATRYVLDIPSVKAVIVGSRLSSKSEAYITSNLKAFSFKLDAEDNALIAKAQDALSDLPGDCGDEYRRPPYLTAAGDMSHHLEETDRSRQVRDAIAKGQRVEYTSGSKWESIAGYCRAVRIGNMIHVSGTTPNSPVAEIPAIGGSSVGSQTVWILDIIEGALKALGSSMKDVVRTRLLVEDLKDCEEVSRAHGWRFGCEGILPSNTLVKAGIVGEAMLVEIETWAVNSNTKPILKPQTHNGISVDNWEQSSYDIEIAPTTGDGGEPPASNTFHVKSLESVLVPWPGSTLPSREAACVRVRSYSLAGVPTGWSPWSKVETALLEEKEWRAKFITAGSRFQAIGDTLRPVKFVKSFSLPTGKSVTKARLYITSLGVYEASINGSQVGDHVLAPGWTSYKHRLSYQTFDVTQLLHEGEDNIMLVEVGEGWYAGRLGFRGGRRYIYDDELAAMAQLEVYFDTRNIWSLCTDQSWKCMASAIVKSELYDGEVYDMREETTDWNTLSGEVRVLPDPTSKLIGLDAPPVRITGKVEPTDIFTSKSGKIIIDFGQNLVGVVQVRSLHTPLGHKVSLVHAEALENGELALRPLRFAKCTDSIISSGQKLEGWYPKFTFHGFRYVQVNGWFGTPLKADFTALVLHTDMRRRGWFACSDPLVNRLHENIVWSMRGNFLSIPTDCPQRDERLGWTGDIQVFCPTATFLYDTVGMLSSWLDDLSSEQLAEDNILGIPGLVIPDVLPKERKRMPQAIWHDVIVLTPWDLYTASGDSTILSRQFLSMSAWVDKTIRRGPDGLCDPKVWQLGDWLDPAAPPEEPGRGRTDGTFVADAYLVHVTSTLAAVCRILGLVDEAARYESEAAKLKETFQHKYITPYGLLANNTQTAVSLALRFSLYPGRNPEQLVVAATSLGRLVRDSKFRIATGFAGTPVICHALTQTGQTQLAYRMLLEKHCPSWLYPVTMGATTVWERWDSMLPDGTINPGEMTSFNHYALGAVAGWLYDTVGGISSEDGWRTVQVCPKPGGSIWNANVSFEGPYGLVKSSWSIEGGVFRLEILIPPNSKAVVVLPGKQIDERNDKATSIVVGSGVHAFSSNYEAGQWPPELTQETFMATRLCDCLAAACFIMVGFDAAVFNAIQTNMHWLDWFNTPKGNLLGIVNTSANIGAIVAGWFLASPTADRFGRRVGIATGCFFTVVAAIFQAFGPHHKLGYFIAGRVFIGLGQGFVTTAGPVYIGEITPSDIRGTVMSIWQVNFAIGSFIAYWINYILAQHNDTLGNWVWKMVVLFQLVTPVLILLQLPFIPESPRWYVQHGDRIEDARKALRRVRATDEEIEIEILGIREAITFEKEVITGSYHALWKDKSVRKRLFLGSIINIGQQLSGQGTLAQYSSTIYKKIWTSTQTINLINALNATFSILFTLNATWTVDRYGRKFLLVVGAVGMGVCMLLVAVIGLETPNTATGTKTESVGIAIVAMLFLFILFYKPSWGATVWIWTSEVFSMNVRTQAVGMCIQMQNVASCIFNQFFPTFYTNCGLKSFFFFMTCNFLLAIFVYFCIPETKKASLEEMDALFGGANHTEKGGDLIYVENKRHSTVGGNNATVETIETIKVPGENSAAN